MAHCTPQACTDKPISQAKHLAMLCHIVDEWPTVIPFRPQIQVLTDTDKHSRRVGPPPLRCSSCLTCSAASLLTRSVVVMATAALCASSVLAPRDLASSGMAGMKASIFMRRPMTPATQQALVYHSVCPGLLSSFIGLCSPLVSHNSHLVFYQGDNTLHLHSPPHAYRARWPHAHTGSVTIDNAICIAYCCCW